MLLIVSKSTNSVLSGLAVPRPLFHLHSCRMPCILGRALQSSSSKMPVVIITGSSSGIGRESAVYFAKKGWKVTLTGRNEKNLKEAVQACIKEGGAKESDIAYVVGDIGTLSVAEQLIKTTLNKFGKLDSLINNAGIISGGLLAEAPIEEYDRLFNTNVRSVIQLTKLALPHLIATKGTIVNISSVAALTSQVNYGYYSMTKSALDAYTKILAVEMAPHGVRVNSVNPGYVETPLYDTVGMTDAQKKETFEYAKKTHALGRMGNADEVAKAIFFLAGPDSTFTTGDILKVDGGFVLMRP